MYLAGRAGALAVRAYRIKAVLCKSLRPGFRSRLRSRRAADSRPRPGRRATAPAPRRWLRRALAVLIAAAAIVLVEASVLNLPYWTSMGASRDSASAHNALGTGLERLPDGLVKVTDATQAYFEVKADGSSRYYRAETASQGAIDAARQADAASGKETVLSTVHLRVESSAGTGDENPVSPASARSLYFQGPSDGTVKVWVVESAGSILPVNDIRANQRVPFSFSWAQVALMAAAALAIAGLKPGSRLWSATLDTSSRRQRGAFAAVFGLLGAASVAGAASIAASSGALSFHLAGGYTYDFDQYGHVADALLHGHAWLDLPVPDALKDAANPYSVATRGELKASGATPLFWDYAFHDGHWYSYFGVLPAVVLFVPYQLLATLLTGHAAMLPAASAELLLMFGFLLFGTLLAIRVIKAVAPRTSLAATGLLCTAFLVGSNAVYLLYRTNFYSIPFASSLLLAALGLWLWIGARQAPAWGKRYRFGRRKGERKAYWQVPGAAPLSLSRVAGGSLAIAATVGCRPTFALAALLAIPLFWPQIRAIARAGLRTLWRPLAAAIVPAAAIVAPLLAYNYIRFGSWLDFGNAYQLTVTDMTEFHTPLANMPATVGYYLALPLRFQRSFPFLAISPTPLPQWSFTEPSVGGIIALCPLIALGFAVPFLRRRLASSGLWGLLAAAVALGWALLVFDAYVGGFGWRYMADFCWLFMLAALAPAARLTCPPGRDALPTALSSGPMEYGCTRFRPWRCVLVLAVAWAVAIAAMSCFTVGRDDALLSNNPGLYLTVRSWFSLMP